MATARQRWTPLERRLWTAVRRGDLVDVRDPKLDPTHVWGPSRTVRAEVLRELLISGPSPLAGHIGGLRLAGARITGSLDLAQGQIDRPFIFLECWFDERINLGSARTRAVFIRSCRVPGMRASGLRTDGELDLRDTLFTTELNLAGAHVSGPLSLAQARLFNPGAIALRADGAEFGNHVFCREGFRATGEVRLLLSRIDGDLDLSTATITNPAGTALMAASVKVGGRVRALNGFRAIGHTSLNHATIGGDLGIAGASFDRPGGTALSCDGAHVGGAVAAKNLIVAGEFSLTGAHVDGSIELHGAVLSNPGGRAFNGDSLHAANGMYCRDNLRAIGEFRLHSAHVGTALILSSAGLINPGRQALTAPNLVVDGDAFFDQGFSATGVVRLVGAHVRGQLGLLNARLSAPNATALIANRMVVDSHLFGEHCRVNGEMHLMGARIGGDLKLDGAVLVNDGSTLNAEGANIGGTLFCGSGFRSTGEISLGGAQMGHQLLLRGAVLRNPGRSVLWGNHLTVGHEILADDDITIQGTLDLARCRVSGAVLLATDGIEGTVDLTQARTDVLELTGTPQGRVSLVDATVRVLAHHPDDWPDAGRLDLHGLTYTELHPLDLPATRWLDWLRRGLPDGYRPQPYAQLATTLRNVGNDRDARAVLLARQRHRRQHLPWWSKPWGWVQDVAVGYGYVPWRAAGWLVVLWLAGWLFFRTQQPLPGGTGDYQPALYALDLLLPVLSIGQRSAFHFTGMAQVVAVVTTVCSWILGIAVLAGLTRALTRN